MILSPATSKKRKRKSKTLTGSSVSTPSFLKFTKISFLRIASTDVLLPWRGTTLLLITASLLRVSHLKWQRKRMFSLSLRAKLGRNLEDSHLFKCWMIQLTTANGSKILKLLCFLYPTKQSTKYKLAIHVVFIKVIIISFYSAMTLFCVTTATKTQIIGAIQVINMNLMGQ